ECRISVEPRAYRPMGTTGPALYRTVVDPITSVIFPSGGRGWFSGPGERVPPVAYRCPAGRRGGRPAPVQGRGPPASVPASMPVFGVVRPAVLTGGAQSGVTGPSVRPAERPRGSWW